jgi:hypothetical protein
LVLVKGHSLEYECSKHVLRGGAGAITHLHSLHGRHAVRVQQQETRKYPPEGPHQHCRPIAYELGSSTQQQQ